MALFSPRFHPVLNSGKGDEDSMVSPEMPTGRAIGQAVLDDQPHGQSDDTVSVMGSRWCQVGHVRVEVLMALRAKVLGIREMDVMRPTGDKIPHVMQRPLKGLVATTAFAASRARPLLVLSSTSNDLRFWQVFHPRDSFRRVWQVLAWSRHGFALLGMFEKARNLAK